MKPILSKDIQSFLERFDNFKDGEFRTIEVISPASISVTLAGQDSAREFDWISMKFEFSGVSKAKLLESQKLAFIDMNDGVNIVCEDDNFTFCIGDYQSESSAKNSICYIKCSSLKYQEGSF